jgi:hypothetical protein
MKLYFSNPTDSMVDLKKKKKINEDWWKMVER